MGQTACFAGRSSCVVAASATILVLLLIACGHPTAIISATTAPPAIGSNDPAHTTKLAGIPFYAKRGMCKRETVWAETKYTLQLDLLVGDKAVASRSIVMPRSYMLKNEGESSSQTLKTALDDLGVLSSARNAQDLGTVCPGDVQKAWENLDADVKAKTQPAFCEEAPENACEKIAAAEADGNLLRLINTAGIVTEVDYEHVYYMNTKTPWIGNASIDAKLQADGTLTEGNLQATDQTWSTILQTIGGLASDVATVGAAKFGAAAPSTAATTPAVAPNFVEPVPPLPPPPPPARKQCDIVPGWPVPKVAFLDLGPGAAPAAGAKPDTAKMDVSISYRYSLTPNVYLHDHVRKDVAITAAAPVCNPETMGITDGSFTITKADESKAKDDPGTIKISGQVALPKPDSAKGAK